MKRMFFEKWNLHAVTGKYLLAGLLMVSISSASAKVPLPKAVFNKAGMITIDRGFTVYPNPASVIAYVLVPEAYSRWRLTFQLLDKSSKRLVFQQPLFGGKNTVNVEHLPRGEYISTIAIDGLSIIYQERFAIR